MTRFRSLKIALIFILFLAQFASANSRATSGMIVSGHPLASEFGLKILKSGGNVVDAAVGAAMVIGVAEPFGSGLGGGGAMLIYLNDLDSLTMINYYACAPQNLPDDVGSYGAETILVPGTVAGLHRALTLYGTISWKNMIDQVIEQVKEGIVVDEYLYQVILESYEKIYSHPQTRSIYLENDFPPPVGTVIRNERILKTLELVSTNGPEIFYNGVIADSIEAVVSSLGGTLQKSDLSQYQVQQVKPLSGTYREHEIVSAPPPMSGASVIEILNILKFRNVPLMGDITTNVHTFRLMIEATKHGYIDRLHFLGDPNFHPVDDEMLVSTSFARTRFDSIRKYCPWQGKSPENSHSPVKRQHDDIEGSTTHISVVDSAGNAVSLTQTLNRFWGSGISVCGFLLNNGMTSFYKDDSLNGMEPGKQPRTTIAPTLVFKDNKLKIVIGSPGGGRIISTLVQVLCQLIDFHKSAHEANSAPRFALHQSGEMLPVEGRFSPTILDSLKKIGHHIQIRDNMDLYFGGVQLILIDPESRILTGSSDPRRSGAVMGY